MSHPQQYGPRQRPPYPPPVPPPPFPTRPYPPYPPPQARPRRRGFTVFGIAVAVLLGGAGLTLGLLESNPNVGDCLSSMDDHFVGGLDVVDCGSKDARYEVVEKTSGYGGGICSDHSDGKTFTEYGGRHHRASWSICAVPVK
ncbi:MAG TPA: hypothetical protein VE172_11960 [Stackebrandtia sp.]|jgi:hypothetical protein|uniref:LppU/SCO3897 family protein n=1 Tax=Stackebrandtia sp. TaxID=2023065 RepID=UPI002D44B73C|nr:hypothetical protein [Stackebrandtia sp.]HZE39514.1 hypothetical protein [Stackebrandtia sp.]